MGIILIRIIIYLVAGWALVRLARRLPQILQQLSNLNVHTVRPPEPNGRSLGSWNARFYRYGWHHG